MKVFILSGFISAMLFIHQISPSSSLLRAPGNHPSSLNSLFESDEILNIALYGNINGLLNNRVGDAKYFPMTITYSDKAVTEDSLSINVKTRGHYRRIKSNCDYPPLLLDFSKASAASNSLFSGQSQLKLVVPCQGEEFIVREWLVYKLYNLLTPFSYKARLVKATLRDEGRQKTTASFYGILLEDDKQMARRNNMLLVKRRMKPQQTLKEDFLKMAMFEYLIGNTDWSVEYLQNINLLAPDTIALPFPVPHDFDLSGIVNCPYSLPAEELELGSVRERRYRGYCMDDIKTFDSTIAFYNGKKKDIYDLYSGCRWLDAKYIKSTLKYLDDFYATINNAKTVKEAFGYPCDPHGTGNVILKGLKD